MKWTNLKTGRARRMGRKHAAILAFDAPEEWTLLSTFTVSSTDDNGNDASPTPGLLRAAIKPPTPPRAQTSLTSISRPVRGSTPGQAWPRSPSRAALPALIEEVDIEGYTWTARRTRTRWGPTRTSRSRSTAGFAGLTSTRVRRTAGGVRARDLRRDGVDRDQRRAQRGHGHGGQLPRPPRRWDNRLGQLRRYPGHGRGATIGGVVDILKAGIALDAPWRPESDLRQHDGRLDRREHLGDRQLLRYRENGTPPQGEYDRCSRSRDECVDRRHRHQRSECRHEHDRSRSVGKLQHGPE